MKLMIFTPTWETESGTAIHPDCRRSIQEQRIDGEITWIVGTDNPFPVGDMRNVLHQYRQARRMFLDGGFDALLTVEHDNVLPDPGAAQRLIDTEGDVVYAPYVLRRSRVISAWRYENDREQGMPLDNYPKDLEAATMAGAWRVAGVGMGCTLYRRHVLEAIDFRKGDQDWQWCPDIPFADDALHAHFISIAQFSVPVGHWHGNELLVPIGRRFRMDKYLALESGHANACGRDVTLIAGEFVELTLNEARELASVGFIVMPSNGQIERAVVEPPEQAVAPIQRKTRKGTVR